MDNNDIKVFVFSQQPLFRQGVVHRLSEESNIQIIGQASLTDKVLLTVEAMPPDIAIVDIDSPTDSGLSLVSSLKQLLPSIDIMILTSNPNDDHLFQALSSQVVAYIGKDIIGDNLVKMIERTASGDHPINDILSGRPQVIGKIIQQFQVISSKQSAKTLVSPLTKREIEILNYVAKGYANKQIAAKIDISEQTIKNHLTSIMSKLNANARTQAVVIAAQKGLISIV